MVAFISKKSVMTRWKYWDLHWLIIVFKLTVALYVARTIQEADSTFTGIQKVKMPELNSYRTGASWTFGHNHQKSPASSTIRKRKWRRGHFQLWVILFKCRSHSYVDVFFYPASLFHGEVLITLNSLTVVFSSVQSTASVCTHKQLRLQRRRNLKAL